MIPPSIIKFEQLEVNEPNLSRIDSLIESTQIKKVRDLSVHCHILKRGLDIIGAITSKSELSKKYTKFGIDEAFSIRSFSANDSSVEELLMDKMIKYAESIHAHAIVCYFTDEEKEQKKVFERFGFNLLKNYEDHGKSLFAYRLNAPARISEETSMSKQSSASLLSDSQATSRKNEGEAKASCSGENSILIKKRPLGSDIIGSDINGEEIGKSKKKRSELKERPARTPVCILNSLERQRLPQLALEGDGEKSVRPTFSSTEHSRLHSVTLKMQYLKMIQGETKTVEGRTATGMFMRWKTGDTVQFFCGREKVRCLITFIRKYESFETLLIQEGFEKCVPNCRDLGEAVALYNSISGYSDKARMHGVLAFGLKKT